jgi:hypothetical protein
MEVEQIAKLTELFDRDHRNIILDLRDARLADRDAARFLGVCEADGMKLEKCPAFVREWMDGERDLRNDEPSVWCRARFRVTLGRKEEFL